jgi:hypothetical protein
MAHDRPTSTICYCATAGGGEVNQTGDFHMNNSGYAASAAGMKQIYGGPETPRSRESDILTKRLCSLVERLSATASRADAVADRLAGAGALAGAGGGGSGAPDHPPHSFAHQMNTDLNRLDYVAEKMDGAISRLESFI